MNMISKYIKRHHGFSFDFCSRILRFIFNNIFLRAIVGVVEIFADEKTLTPLHSAITVHTHVISHPSKYPRRPSQRGVARRDKGGGGKRSAASA